MLNADVTRWSCHWAITKNWIEPLFGNCLKFGPHSPPFEANFSILWWCVFGRSASLLAETIPFPSQDHWCIRCRGEGGSLQFAAKPRQNACLWGILPYFAQKREVMGDAQSSHRQWCWQGSCPCKGAMLPAWGAFDTDGRTYVSAMQRQACLPSHQLWPRSWSYAVFGRQRCLIASHCQRQKCLQIVAVCGPAVYFGINFPVQIAFQ